MLCLLSQACVKSDLKMSSATMNSLKTKKITNPLAKKEKKENKSIDDLAKKKHSIFDIFSLVLNEHMNQKNSFGSSR